MARLATTADPFSAIAEPARRELLEVMADREYSVNELVVRVELDQPSVSKHLSVLRAVGLVSLRKEGRRRYYRTEPTGLKEIHEWTSLFKQRWRNQLRRIKKRAEVAPAGKPKRGKEEEQTKGGAK